MLNIETEKIEGPKRSAHNGMRTWFFQLENQDLFVLSLDLARLAVSKSELVNRFNIPVKAQKEILHTGAGLLVARHEEEWTVTAVRLNGTLGEKEVTKVKETYQLLLEYIKLNFGKGDLYLLKQEAIRLYNSLPSATQEEVKDRTQTVLSIIPDW